MSDKLKIILIYSSVAIVSLIMIGGFITLRHLNDLKEQANRPAAVDMGQETAREMLTLTKNLIMTNQDGEELSVFDLKDKVWVFAQFFAKCPACAERNYTDLLKIYKQYKDHPDFMIVCMSIDPETDNVAKLKEYAEVVDADSSKWVFLTGDREEMHAYMNKEMKYTDVRERTVPEEIATKGKYAHDLGLAIFDKGLVMRAKVNLANTRKENQHLYEYNEQRLHETLQNALGK